jgi:hypothetical protein
VFSNYGAVTGTTTTTDFREFGEADGFSGITASRIPGNSTSIRAITAANYADLNISGVNAQNLILNTSNLAFIPLRFDMSSSGVISNFTGQQPLTTNTYTPTNLSARISFGPTPESINTLGICTGSAFKAIKMS